MLYSVVQRWPLSPSCDKKKKNCLFDTHTIIQSISSSEMCSLHLTHPSAHTPGAVGSRHCGAWGSFGGSVPLSRFKSHFSRGQFLPEPRFEPITSGYKSDALSIRPRLPLPVPQKMGYDTA